MKTKNILFICEGSDDERLLKSVWETYCIDVNFEIYKYKTNIHVFAKHLFQNYALIDGEIRIDEIDIIQILKEFRFEDILSKKFTDILFVFDFDPQDPRYDYQVLRKLMHVFSDSTNLGQLFLNYPMVESAIDFNTLPDLEFKYKYCLCKDLKFNQYKNSVKKNSIFKNFDSVNDHDLRIILRQTFDKMMYLTKGLKEGYIYLLKVQNDFLSSSQKIYIISTCLLFLRDYNEEVFLDYIEET